MPREFFRARERKLVPHLRKQRKYPEALPNICVTTQKRERLTWIPLLKANTILGMTFYYVNV